MGNARSNQPTKHATSQGAFARRDEDEHPTRSPEEDAWQKTEKRGPEDGKQVSRRRSKKKRKRTSYTECTVDALALKTEEGRGDRRNVQGELHASEEP